MEFTFPDWVQRTSWRLLCQSIPEFLKLYTALKDLHGKKIHQTQARTIAVLYDAAVKGVDEWERKEFSAIRCTMTRRPRYWIASNWRCA